MKNLLLIGLLTSLDVLAQSFPTLVFTNTLSAKVVINTNKGSIYVVPNGTLDLSGTYLNYDQAMLSSQLTAWLGTGILTSPTADPVGDLHLATTGGVALSNKCLVLASGEELCPPTDGGCGAGLSAIDGGGMWVDCVGNISVGDFGSGEDHSKHECRGIQWRSIRSRLRRRSFMLRSVVHFQHVYCWKQS